MACKRCEISTFIKDNGVDLCFVTETWLCAQGDEAKTAELAPSGFDVKSSSVWNSIPTDVRCAPSLSSFKSRLKTYLFRSVYID